MRTLDWAQRELTCAGLERLIQEMPAAEKLGVTRLYLSENQLEELPDSMASSFPSLTR